MPKLRSFQYKIVQNALVTNVMLYKLKIKSSPFCSMCNQDIEETIVHLFIDCPTARNIWLKIEDYMSDHFGVEPQIDFQVDNVLFNRVVPVWSNIKNFVCLVVKYYIYRQRCLGQAASYQGVIRYIGFIQKLEFFYATRSNKLHIHRKKWHLVSSQGK